ncbi:hypothetical protein [Kistimonas asteriae]|uniref:hypothetical protein n=1 Tax=Kistimonas asteriae TaxID=517724 RepID=UPI001BA59E80|nr:hypothetical protein [Kistimonas asteriae]
MAQDPNKANLSVTKKTKKLMDIYKATHGGTLADLCDQMWEAFEREQQRKTRKSGKGKRDDDG